ncbi:hypothetical protein MRX96_058073 [Rhipicephalus microplus]
MACRTLGATLFAFCALSLVALYYAECEDESLAAGVFLQERREDDTFLPLVFYNIEGHFHPNKRTRDDYLLDVKRAGGQGMLIFLNLSTIATDAYKPEENFPWRKLQISLRQDIRLAL